MGSHDEVGVAALALAFGESQGDGDFTGGLDALAPESVADLDGGEGYGTVGIAADGVLGSAREDSSGHDEKGQDAFLHFIFYYFIFYYWNYLTDICNCVVQR